MYIRKIDIKVISFLFFFILMFPSSKIFAFPYKEWDINIRGSISEGYDDNITLTKENKIEDFITTLGLNVNARREGKRRAIEFTSNIVYNFNAKFSDIKNSSESLTLNFMNEFSKYDRIRLDYSFTHTQTPASFEEEFGRVRGRLNSYQNRFNLNYARNISEHFTIIADYVKDYVKTISPEGDITDSSVNRLGFEIDYIPRIATTFLLSYNLAKRKDEDAFHSITTGIKHYITERLYFDGRGGVDFLTSFGVTKNFVQGSLTDEIDKKSVASLSFIRQEQSASNRRDVFRSWQIRGVLRRQILEGLNGSLSGFYGKSRFIVSGSRNQFTGVNGLISYDYDFNENLRGSFRYSYSILDSTNGNGGYSKNTALLNLTAAF